MPCIISVHMAPNVVLVRKDKEGVLDDLLDTAGGWFGLEGVARDRNSCVDEVF